MSGSSPWCSVALFEGAELLASREQEAPRAASGTLLSLLETCLAESARVLSDVEVFAADVGPGSFMGSRVGVMLAKTLALVKGRMVAGVESFNLMDTARPVAVPCRKHEWWLRVPGSEPVLATELPPGTPTYGPGVENPVFPLARRWAPAPLELVAPELLVPRYRIEPSISQPKVPYRPGVGA